VSTARDLVRSGSAATAAQLVRILSLQATHIVVRRLVPPEEMAIWSWLEVVFLLLATVRDLGVTAHVQRLRPRPLGTLLRLELVWGAILAGLVTAGAPLLVLAFRDHSPAVIAGLRVLAVYLLIEGVAAVALTWYEAELRLERSLPAELARVLTYCATVLAAAAQGWGFWSFVAAQLVSQIVYAVLLWRGARPGLVLLHVPGTTGDLVRGSLPLAGIWLLSYAVTYVDLIVVGRLFAREAVGLYAFAYGYAFLVTRVLQPPIARSLYPALVAYADDRAEQFRAFRLATVLFLALEVPAALFIALNSERITLLLGGAEWAAAAPLLALLALAPIVDPLGRFGGELLVARHADRARLVALALQLVVLVGAGVLLSQRLASPFGMAWANFAPAGSLVVLVALVRQREGRELGRLGRELVEVYLVPLAPFAAVFVLTDGGSWTRLAASGAAALLSIGWLARRHAAEWRSFLGRARIEPGVPGPLPGA
jgi:PST family polysaccharide transporter